MTCNYDYYTTDWYRLSYVVFAFVNHYLFPVMLTFFFYTKIVKAVIMHERALKEQAKKMNVDTLRSGVVKTNLTLQNHFYKDNSVPG